MPGLTPSSTIFPLAAAELQALLPRLGSRWVGPELLQSLARNPEARVHPVSEQLAFKVVQRCCQPPFEEPFLFGQVAAAHALNGLYARGARPVAALALLTLPEPDIPSRMLVGMEAGLSACCQLAEVELGGIHVMPGPTLSCGLLALGQLNPRNMEHGSPPSAGDRVILGKPLGDACYRAALARGLLHAHDVREWLDSALLQPNCSGPALDCLDGVHQVLAVEEGGLAAVLDQVGRPGMGVRLERGALPLLHRAVALAGEAAGGDPYPALLADSPLNGPLVVVCHPDTVTEALAIFLQQGFGHAAVVGEVVAGQEEVWRLA